MCSHRELRPSHLEPPLASNEEATRGRGKSVALVLVRPNWLVRPNQPGHQPTSALSEGLTRGPLSFVHVALLLDRSVSCSGGPYNPCDDKCHALIRRNLVPWIMPHHLGAFLAQNHLHTFSNQYLWNLSINHPMLSFIPFDAHILHDS